MSLIALVVAVSVHIQRIEIPFNSVLSPWNKSLLADNPQSAIGNLLVALVLGLFHRFFGKSILFLRRAFGSLVVFLFIELF